MIKTLQMWNFVKSILVRRRMLHDKNFNGESALDHPRKPLGSLKECFYVYSKSTREVNFVECLPWRHRALLHTQRVLPNILITRVWCQRCFQDSNTQITQRGEESTIVGPIYSSKNNKIQSNQVAWGSNHESKMKETIM